MTINFRWGVVVIQKRLFKGYILIESLVALTMMTIFFLFVLDAEVSSLRQKEKYEQKARLSRIVYSEIKEYLRYGGTKIRLVQDGQQQVEVKIIETELGLAVIGKSNAETIEVYYEE